MGRSHCEVCLDRAQRGSFPVTLMCPLLGVSRSGYHAWARRPASPRRAVQERLPIEIRAIRAANDGNYGAPQITRASAPNPVWLTDITFIWTAEGWLYLAAVLDQYTREIVGWVMDRRMTRKLVIDALSMAFWRKKPPAGLIHHSDRGSH